MAIEQDRSGRIAIRDTGVQVGGIRAAQAPATPNYSGLATGFKQVSAVADSMTQFGFAQINKQQKKRGRRAGLKAGTETDEDGNPVPLSGLDGFDTSTVFGQAFQESATQAYSEQVRIDGRAKAQELAAAHQGDPEGFTEAYGAYIDETLAGTDDQIREVVEPDLQAQMRLGVSDRIVEQTAAEREATVQTLNQGFQDLQDETLNLIRAGKGDDPRVQELVEQADGYWQNAVDNNLVSEPEAEAAKESFKDARTMTAAMREVTAAVDAGDFDGARQMIDGLREDAPDLGLSVEQTKAIEKNARSYLRRQEAEQARQKREAQAARAKQQGQTYYEFQKRMASDDPPTLEEVDAAVEAGQLSPGQGGSLYGTVAAQREADQLESRKRISAELMTDYKTGKLDFDKLREAHEGNVLTQSAWLEAREHNYKRGLKAAERNVEQFIAEANGALNRGEPNMADPDIFQAVLMKQAESGSITFSRARTASESYRNSFDDWRGERQTRKRMFREMEQGGVKGTDTRKAMEDYYAQELDPLEAGPQATADVISRAGYVPTPLKRQFDQIDTMGEEEGATLLATFQQIRAADPNGGTEAMLKDELGDDYKKLDALARIAPQSEKWSEAIGLANKAADTSGSYSRRLQEVMQAEDADDALDRLQDGVRRIGEEELGRDMGLFGIMQGAADFLIPVHDQRLQAFRQEAEAYDIDLENRELPDSVVRDAARNARDLIGTGNATTPSEAVKQGLNRTLRQWGPERVGDDVRWTKNPINWHANRANPDMVPGFTVGQTELQQDFRYQMRAAGKSAPGGTNWDDINLRFDNVPGASDEWQVWYEDPQQPESWHPLTVRQDDEDTQVTYSYEWGGPDEGAVSLHNVLYQAALDGKEGSNLAVNIKDLGIKFLTRWAADVDVQRAIDARANARKWQRFWADPTVEDVTEGAKQWRRDMERSRDALIEVLSGKETSE